MSSAINDVFMLKLKFAPRPGSMRSAPLALVGGGHITCFVPDMLTGTDAPARSTTSGISPLQMRWLAATTLRMSWSHHLDKSAGSAMPVPEAVGVQIWRLFKHLVARDITLPTIGNLVQLAGLCAVASPRQRVNLTWVGGYSHQDAWLVPPPESMLPALLDDLAAFVVQAKDAEPGVVAEVLAYQLTHIHPLEDGNGRTLRALLVQRAVLTNSWEPIALVWLMVFHKLSLGVAWRRPARPAAGLDTYEVWRGLVRSLFIADATWLHDDPGGALSEKLALLHACFGYVSFEVLVGALGCGNGLARKILERLDNDSFRWKCINDRWQHQPTTVWLDEAVKHYLLETESARVDKSIQ